jgi:Xaa-Pro aminopeptidase
VPVTGIVETLRCYQGHGRNSLQLRKPLPFRMQRWMRWRAGWQAGMTELEIALGTLKSTSVSMAVNVLPFENYRCFSVAKGCACSHAKPSSREVEPGDARVIDMGRGYHGYASDITRTLCIGHTFRTFPESIYDGS